MDFKEMVETDITSVFLNPDELGETHLIEGTPVLCVIGRDFFGRDEDMPEGITQNEMRLYVKKGDIARPSVGKRLSIDGSYHLVDSVHDEMGMLAISLEEYRGRM